MTLYISLSNSDKVNPCVRELTEAGIFQGKIVQKKMA